MTAIPCGNENLALVIRIDQANQVAQHDAMLVAEARARQDHGRKAGIRQVDCDAGWHQDGFARMDLIAASMQARKSMPAEPAVAYCGA
jgi:hypothetical protein